MGSIDRKYRRVKTWALDIVGPPITVQPVSHSILSKGDFFSWNVKWVQVAWDPQRDEQWQATEPEKIANNCIFSKSGACGAGCCRNIFSWFFLSYLPRYFRVDWLETVLFVPRIILSWACGVTDGKYGNNFARSVGWNWNEKALLYLYFFVIQSSLLTAATV